MLAEVFEGWFTRIGTLMPFVVKLRLNRQADGIGGQEAAQ
jgi:hypothetical protein